MNTYGDIFVKNPHYDKKEIDIPDITLVSNDINHMLENINQAWGIERQKDDLTELEPFTLGLGTNNEKFRNYILELNRNLQKEFKIAEEHNGIFVNYRFLYDRFEKLTRTEQLTESIITVMSYADDIHGAKFRFLDK